MEKKRLRNNRYEEVMRGQIERKLGNGEWKMADGGKDSQDLVDRMGIRKLGKYTVTLAFKFLTLGVCQ